MSDIRGYVLTPDAQYGAISSASSLVNTVLPVIGGIGIDYWGSTYAAIICSIFIMVGAIISAAVGSVQWYHLTSGRQHLALWYDHRGTYHHGVWLDG